jgi:hypothetical protein
LLLGGRQPASDEFSVVEATCEGEHAGTASKAQHRDRRAIAEPPVNDGLVLTPARAKEPIGELERRLAARGIPGSVRIVGGGAMVLRFPDDPEMRVTTDVDAAYEPRPR